MPWAAAGLVVGAVGTMYAANTAGDSAAAATDAQSRAAQGQLELGKDQLDFNKQVYAEGAPYRTAAQNTALKVGDAQLQGMQFATSQAQDLNDYNKSTFRPLETGIVNDAQTYDTAQRRADAAAGAQADVDQSFQATRDANDRDLARSGIAPGSAKAMSLMQDATIAQAATRAGAGTMAVRNVEQQGYSRKMDAAALGRNLPSNQATQQQIATTTGNAAVGSSMQGLTAQQSGAAGVNTGFAGAISAGNSAGNLFGGAAAGYEGVATADAAGYAALGKAIGYAGSAYSSDEAIKSGTGKPIDTKAALKGITKTPVQRSWMYDATEGKKAGVRAEDRSRPHDGPMAQQVQKHMGDHVAPGGKQIDIPSMNGHLIAGMQEIVKRLDRLETRSGAKGR